MITVDKRRWTSEKRNAKRVCFAGVAEQFALAEASMNVWSLNDGLQQPSSSLQGLSRQRVSLLAKWESVASQKSDFKVFSLNLLLFLTS